LIPNIAEGDVYVCGPDGFATEIVRASTMLGIPTERIHVEDFSF